MGRLSKLQKELKRMKVRKETSEIIELTAYVYTYIHDDVEDWRRDMLEFIATQKCVETECTTLEEWVTKVTLRGRKPENYKVNVVYMDRPNPDNDGFEITPDKTIMFYSEEWGRSVGKDISLTAIMHEGKVWEDD